MAILAIVHSAAITREKYDALRPKVRWEIEHPAGAILHSCAFDQQGGMRVVDVWESAEQMDSFFKTRLGPALHELNLQPPQVEIYPLYNLDAFPGIEQHVP